MESRQLRSAGQIRDDRVNILGVGVVFRELMPDEHQTDIDAINMARPDIIWVGLSRPKQDSWMARRLGRIEAPVMVGVGAAFDFLAGTKRQAPHWMQRNGLEWLFRLCSEPRCLWRRYVVPGFIILAVGDLARRAIRRSEEAPAGAPSRK
jgi:N-acetylglucosaminyldiphosphoundecaprenol N-acetyl-beta-D-mannosaminyltransferase